MAEEEIIDPKYGTLNPELVRFLKDCEYSYFREDKPIPFIPECGLYLYPIQVRHFEEFATCSSCLSLDKNTEAAGIRMSHLEYLLSRIELPGTEGQVWRYKINRLFELVFRLDLGYECTSCHHILKYDSQEVRKFSEDCQTFVKALMENRDGKTVEVPPEPELRCPNKECSGTRFQHVLDVRKDAETQKLGLYIHGRAITKDEFNRMRQIVLYQNFPDYVDESWVDPEVKKDHDEKMRLEQQSHDLHATIEKKVVCLSVTTNYKFEEIYDMSIRRFTLALSTVDDLINYKLLKTAQYSGLSGLPKDFKVDHWIYKPNKDIYGDSYKSTDSIQAV